MSSNNLKKVLTIAYHFPPDNSSGARRPYKFFKYLPYFGLQNFVITKYDNSKFGSEKIYKVGEFNIKIPEMKKTYNQKIKYFFYRQLRSIQKKILFPDTEIIWSRNVENFIKTNKEIQNCDLIISTGPPHSTHLSAINIKKFLNIPVIIDYRDAWSINPFYNFKGRKLEKIVTLEKNVFDNADKIIFISNEMMIDYINLYPEYKQKFEVITNGYDPEDYEDIPMMAGKQDNFNRVSIS